MRRCLPALLIALAFTLVSAAPQEPPAPIPPADSQPTSQPAGSGSSLRKPQQAEILRKLLLQREPTQPILPTPDATTPAETASQPATGTSPGQLLVDGTFIVERSGRLVIENNRALFVFHVDGDNLDLPAMELNPNQLLETMEREAELGFTDFVISAEVTRYRGHNFLNLRKVLRRIEHGNLGP